MVATMHKVAAGNGYQYYLRNTAANDTTARGRSSLSEYYNEHGEAPGTWRGTGPSALDITEGTEVARDFGAKFQHVVVPREDALRAMKLGQSLANKQLELVRPYELERADRARRRLDNIRKIQQEREQEQQQRTAGQARQQELTRIQTARDQQLARFPPEMARLLAISMPPPERELDRHPPDPGNSTARAGREARTREHERGRDARGI